MNPDTSVSYAMPGMWVTEYSVQVPLDWQHPTGEQIQLFVRELVDIAKKHHDLPLLAYLQGGPGGANPRPLTGRDTWLQEALENYRVILVDQRGTGRSTPLEAEDVLARGNAEAGADYLARFRADSIIQDMEHVRQVVYRGARWSTLAQSFGGWLTLTYLSQAPEALKACYICGGVPGTPPSAEDVYRRTFSRVEDETAEFYQRYPQDLKIVSEVADRLHAEPILLPDGDHLTVRRFQTLGLDFGMKPGFERMHWLLETAFTPSGRLSTTFLEQVMTRTSCAANPLFWTLQETIYGDPQSGATAWAAQRARDQRPQFSEETRPLLFTGEMAFPWMFQEIRLLRGFAPAVEALAQRTDWSPLYDYDSLKANEVPVAAAVYYDDMFVDAGLQLDTLSRMGNSHYWVTNEFEHDGIGSGRTFTRLRDMVLDAGGENA